MEQHEYSDPDMVQVFSLEVQIIVISSNLWVETMSSCFTTQLTQI